MTSFSGTAYEAHRFGLRNIIFGEDGYRTYQKQIEDGTYYYIANKDELENVLKIYSENVSTKESIPDSASLFKEIFSDI